MIWMRFYKLFCKSLNNENFISNPIIHFLVPQKDSNRLMDVPSSFKMYLHQTLSCCCVKNCPDKNNLRMEGYILGTVQGYSAAQRGRQSIRMLGWLAAIQPQSGGR